MKDFNWLGVGGALLSAIIVIVMIFVAVRAARGEFLRSPARFNHWFDGEVVLRENQGGKVFAIGEPCFGTYGEACAKRIGRYCMIWFVDKSSPSGISHEIAHCNGWPADHPD